MVPRGVAYHTHSFLAALGGVSHSDSTCIREAVSPKRGRSYYDGGSIRYPDFLASLRGVSNSEFKYTQSEIMGAATYIVRILSRYPGFPTPL